MSCPYKKSFVERMNEKEKKIEKDTNSEYDPEKALPKTCPFAKNSKGPNPHVGNPTPKQSQVEEKKEEKPKDENNVDEDSEDEQPTGGCPVMNKGNKFC